MNELTKDQAIVLAESGFWKDMNALDIAVFQSNNELLCMPFEVYHEAMNEALERPVFTHEFADTDSLLKELMGEKPQPSFQEIMDMIPSEKRIVVVSS